MSATLTDEVVEHLPHLRSFARMIARDRVLADDLVQETVLRALTHLDQFQLGTNLKAWLTTILRNAYFNEKRREHRVTQIAYAFVAEPTARPGEQEAHLEMLDFERAFATLPAVQREALDLVGVKGVPYEEAARTAGCSIGTMKSRASRARVQLRQILDNPTTPIPANDAADISIRVA